MNIYKLTRPDTCGYDEYDSVIVAAKNEDDAKTIHPSHPGLPVTDDEVQYDSWVRLSKVQVELIGIANPSIPRGVICASFNAG